MNFKHPANVEIYKNQTKAEKLIDKTVGFIGSLRFIYCLSIFILLWIAINTLPFVFHYDPYPWILLNLFFSAQATYASPLILLAQNRQNKHDALRAEADYANNSRDVGLDQQQLDLLKQILIKLQEMESK